MVETSVEVAGGPAEIRRLVALAVILGVAAIGLSAWLAIDPAPVTGDVWLTLHIQDLDGTRRLAEVVNAVGSWRLAPLAVVAGVCVWRDSSKEGERTCRTSLLVAFLVVAALTFWSDLVKEIVGSPRPSEAYGVYVDHVRDSYGFPSGHVYGDVVVYGFLAVLAPLYVHPRLVLPVRVVLVGVIVLAGPARVVVGAHWPSDTLGGYLWGVAVLCAALAAWRRWAAGRRNR